MREVLIEFLERLRVGEAQTYRNLTLFPLTGGMPAPGRYLLLDEALESGFIEIREKDPAGTVPEVLVTNRADTPVLILDGEVLIGAHQNRLLNQSVLVAPRSECLIGVSCVEAGRWSDLCSQFTTSGERYNPRGRQRMAEEIALSLFMGGQTAPNQSRIWTDIDRLLADVGADSMTASIHDAYVALVNELDEYARHFRLLDGQTGLVFALNGEVMGFDAFDRPDTLVKLTPKLIRSYALDTVVDENEEYSPDQTAAEDLIRKASVSRIEVFPSPGLGKQVCVTSRHTVGIALMMDLNVLHLSVFARPNVRRRKCDTRLLQPSLRKPGRQQKGQLGDALQ